MSTLTNGQILFFLKKYKTSMQHSLLTATLLLVSALTVKAQSANPYLIKNSSISLDVTKNYLRRSAAMTGMVDLYQNATCYKVSSFQDEQAAFENFVNSAHPKLLLGTGLWVEDQYELGEDCKTFLANCKTAADKVHSLDSDIILGASLDEVISDRVMAGTGNWRVAIPSDLLATYNTCLQAANAQHPDYGLPTSFAIPGGVTPDFFDYHDIYSNNLLYTGCYWVDMTKPMTQLWYFYLAKNYIDNGFEMLRLGQITVTAKNDNNYANTFQLTQAIRQYAKTHARRNVVLLDQQAQPIKYGINGKSIYLFDVCGLPTRLHSRKAVTAGSGLDVNGAPTTGQDYEAVISTGSIGPEWIQGNLISGGITEYWGSSTTKLPCYAELDNTGDQMFATDNSSKYPPAPNISNSGVWETGSGFPWGWDECSWFYNQSETYEQQSIIYLYNQVKCMSNGMASFCMPIKRNYDYHNKNGDRQVGKFNVYYDNGANFRNLSQAIKQIWANDLPSSVTNVFNSWPTALPSSKYIDVSSINASDVQFANLNNDSYEDFMRVNYYNNIAAIDCYWGSSNGAAIATQITLPTNGGDKPSALSKMTVGDFNGDGYDDFMLTANKAVGEYYTTYVVYLNDKYGGFSVGATSYGGPSWGERIYVGDFNGDGYDDLLATADRNTLQQNTWNGYRVYLNQRVSPQNYSTQYHFSTPIDNADSSLPSWGERVFVGDYDGDGNDDLLITSDYSTNPNYVKKGYKIYHSQMSKNLAPPSSLFKLANLSNGNGGVNEDYPSWGENIYPCDLNGDGHTDIVTTAASQFGVSWDGYIAYVSNEQGNHFMFSAENTDNTIFGKYNSGVKVDKLHKSKQVLASYDKQNKALILNSFTYSACQPTTFANSRMGSSSTAIQYTAPNKGLIGRPTNIEVSPNPSSRYFDVVSPVIINHYAITDIAGKIMKSASIPNTTHFSVNTEELKAGVYILRLDTPKGVVNAKIVKAE